jgi:hypothetical protein
MVVLLKYSLIKYYVKPNSEICKDINVREYRRGNQKLTIQRNWQNREHKTEKTKQKQITICVGHHYTQTNNIT